MLITIRKSDNKLIAWNCGNIAKDDSLQELQIAQDRLPAGNFLQMFYDPTSEQIIHDPDYIDPVEEDSVLKQEMSQLESKQIRPIREIIKKLQAGTAIDPEDQDWKRFVALSNEVEARRALLNEKG
jgi:hypothetical protein